MVQRQACWLAAHTSYASGGFAQLLPCSPHRAWRNWRHNKQKIASGEKPMRPFARAAARLAAMSILAFALSSRGPTVAAAAENWDLYIYNPVATVAAVKGMNVIIEQIEKETNGELKVRLHLGGSLPINTTNITQAVSDDVVQMGDDGYFTGNVPIAGILRLPMLIRTRDEYAKAAAVVDPYLEAA